MPKRAQIRAFANIESWRKFEIMRGELFFFQAPQSDFVSGLQNMRRSDLW